MNVRTRRVACTAATQPPWAPRLAIPVIAALTIAIASCGKPPPGGLDVIPSDAEDPRLAGASASPPGATGADVTSWESMPWRDDAHPWLAYPAHAQLQIDHEQGRVPTGVVVYISFVESGENPAVAPGDLARIVDVNDEFVTVWNDTNSAYFARVVLLF